MYLKVPEHDLKKVQSNDPSSKELLIWFKDKSPPGQYWVNELKKQHQQQQQEQHETNEIDIILSRNNNMNNTNVTELIIWITDEFTNLVDQRFLNDILFLTTYYFINVTTIKFKIKNSVTVSINDIVLFYEQYYLQTSYHSNNKNKTHMNLHFDYPFFSPIRRHIQIGMNMTRKTAETIEVSDLLFAHEFMEVFHNHGRTIKEIIIQGISCEGNNMNNIWNFLQYIPSLEMITFSNVKLDGCSCCGIIFSNLRNYIETDVKIHNPFLYRLKLEKCQMDKTATLRLHEMIQSLGYSITVLSLIENEFYYNTKCGENDDVEHWNVLLHTLQKNSSLETIHIRSLHGDKQINKEIIQNTKQICKRNAILKRCMILHRDTCSDINQSRTLLASSSLSSLKDGTDNDSVIPSSYYWPHILNSASSVHYKYDVIFNQLLTFGMDIGHPASYIISKNK